jgi:uncharacterized protein (DUF1778 family)
MKTNPRYNVLCFRASDFEKKIIQQAFEASGNSSYSDFLLKAIVREAARLTRRGKYKAKVSTDTDALLAA